MPVIRLTTRIKAPVERVFDLSRSIDLHLKSAENSGEIVAAGRTSGLLELGEEVTWNGSHLGFQQTLQVQLTKCQKPHHFTDEMISGAFLRMEHQHHFAEEDAVTIMTDEFDYKSRRDPLGWALENSFLTAYLRRFLSDRNKVIKKIAESEQWKEYLPEPQGSSHGLRQESLQNAPKHS